MGLMDNIRRFFSGSGNNQPAQPQINEDREKSRLAETIIDLVNNIKSINSFDSSIWNLSTVTIQDLKRKSLEELKSLKSSLENRLEELNQQNQIGNPKANDLQGRLWTGEKPKGMSHHDFDRAQRYR